MYLRYGSDRVIVSNRRRGVGLIQGGECLFQQCPGRGFELADHGVNKPAGPRLPLAIRAGCSNCHSSGAIAFRSHGQTAPCNSLHLQGGKPAPG